MNEILTAMCERVGSAVSGSQTLVPVILPGSGRRHHRTMKIDEYVNIDLSHIDPMDIIRPYTVDSVIANMIKDLEIELLGKVCAALERPLIRALGDISAASANKFTVFGLQTFLRGALKMAEYDVKSGIMLVSFDVWNDIVTNPDFTGRLTVATNKERLSSGYLGRLDNWDIYTDAYRYAEIRTIPYGAWYMIPKDLGTMVGQMSFFSVAHRSDEPKTPVGLFQLKYVLTFAENCLYGGIRTPSERLQ